MYAVLVETGDQMREAESRFVSLVQETMDEEGWNGAGDLVNFVRAGGLSTLDPEQKTALKESFVELANEVFGVVEALIVVIEELVADAEKTMSDEAVEMTSKPRRRSRATKRGT